MHKVEHPVCLDNREIGKKLQTIFRKMKNMTKEQHDKFSTAYKKET